MLLRLTKLQRLRVIPITLRSLALRIFEVFVRILLIVDLSLNQTLLTFLLCVSQTWMTQLILAVSLWEIFCFNPKGF